MTVSTRRLRDERGFTITEVVVAAMILLVGVLGALTLLDGANKASQATKAREGATNLARELVEAARVVNYTDLAPSQVAVELQAQPGLADAVTGTAGWQLVRRNVTYTVTASVCSVDDGTLTPDGYGDHTGGTFCADSATTGTADNNPDDYKRMTLDVAWTIGGKTRTTRQEAVINNPGSAFAPAIKTLVPNKGNGVPINSVDDTAVIFNATTSSTPAEVKWSIDNIEAGKATGAGKSWTFTWNIPNKTEPNHTVDGTYLISAVAYDIYGQAGTGRTATMVINRYAPDPPEKLVGGRNPLWGSDFMEFEWAPNPERDVFAYRVHRMAGVLPSATNDPVVCQTVTDGASPTSCWATEPTSSEPTVYYVRAVAPNHVTNTGEETSSVTADDIALDAENVVVVPGSNQRPDAPTNLREDTTVDDGGLVTLTWDVPSDPDGSIRYFRIYRDDTSSYTTRYGGTGSGTQNVWTDRASAPGAHTYWVTAVDDNLAESALSDPATP